MKNIIKTGFGLGGLIILGSIGQWYIRFPDISQLFFGLGIGCIVLAFNYIYHYMIEMDIKYKDQKRLFDSLRTYLHSNEIVKFGDLEEDR